MPETFTLSWLSGNGHEAAGALTGEGGTVISGRALTTDPDERLLERIGHGDMAAVSILVSRKLPKLLSLGRRILGDAAEAEDVAQETLMRTWKQAKIWVPGKARIDTWMHRVALNLCYDRLRRRRDSVSSDDVEIADTAASAPQQIEAAQTVLQVKSAIDTLPERQREAIVLTYYQELPNIEAAALMRVSVEALESLLARARRTLRTLMSDTETLKPNSAPQKMAQKAGRRK